MASICRRMNNAASQLNVFHRLVWRRNRRRRIGKKTHKWPKQKLLCDGGRDRLENYIFF